MPDILPLLLCLQPALSKTTCRQLSHIIVAMLTMTGRITQKGIARWTDKGASYRTIQRFFRTNIDWTALQWAFFLRFVYDPKGGYLLAGDETVIRKSGKRTYGIDRFFSSLADRAIPGIACFSIALIHGGKRQAFSLANEQVLRTEQEKQQAKQRQQQRKERKHKKGPQKPKGRPKGSKNQNKAQQPLSAELVRIQVQAQKVCQLIKKRLWATYFVLDGHVGNPHAAQMVRPLDLHLISKMRADAALYQGPTPMQKQRRPRLKYGDRLDMGNLPEALLCSEQIQDGYRTQVYKVLCRHKQFAHLLNVVILKKTHLQSGRVGHVILFSSDLFLTAATLIDYYTLRFQIENERLTQPFVGHDRSCLRDLRPSGHRSCSAPLILTVQASLISLLARNLGPRRSGERFHGLERSVAIIAGGACRRKRSGGGSLPGSDAGCAAVGS